MKVIEIRDLVKKYGNNIAVDNINLSIDEGEIYGLLGPNGAGKSTIINMLCSLLKPNSGSLKIFGVDVQEHNMDVKKKIGLVPQNVAVYKDFTAYENVKFFGELYGLRGNKLKESVNKALEFVGLLDVAKDQAKSFSGGMVRRLNIACAIVHEPKLIIMDEPTVGIDPQSRNHILNAVKTLNKNGTTIIYTTHYMEEAENLCSKIGIIDKGKIIVEGSTDELKSMVSDKKTLQIRVDDVYKLEIENIKKIKGVSEIIIDQNCLTINTQKEINNLDILIKSITDSNVKILDLGFKEITLETVFLTLTGRSLRD
ncbi:ABC transporter ATP-binding protein [Clostridium disporicum]|uniref:ABC-type multidrug transport system, ATPase component n=1 Tax=Clostridium disporicum TaxID=84024 RepID=A0A174IAN8_9CLOT|nr:ABC transporter ATP-binding protein [Clostridium disporicum]MDU6341235.1 ABC transporter ATP-binding protein [Clostridium sp.]CUO84352.1 ABC-type multidrug transport system%2C ATPase component [Clostridium disporicum]